VSEEAPAPRERGDPRVEASPRRRGGRAVRLVPWVISAACFAYLYLRIDAAAGERGAFAYLSEVFEAVDWWRWLALMVPYSFLYLLIDTAVLWRVVGWFNARIAYGALLPIRASTYIISIVNEQVGKGTIAVYLNRRHGVPGWQVGSSMLFIMFCEFYYLMSWALVGVTLRWDALPRVFHAIPVFAALAFAFFAAFLFFFRSERFAGNRLRERDLLRAFRRARIGHYLGVVAIRSPAILAAVFVYSRAAALFGVEIGFVDMLGILPVIFFGTLVPGPFRAVAVAMWPTLFPEKAGEMTAFGFVQHNFFLLFNAAIGLVFLRRANRELFGNAPAEQGTA
jgi:hypothetical protein